MATSRRADQLKGSSKDWVFYFECKWFTIIVGGRPAFILAVGAPLTIIGAFTLLIGGQDLWLKLAIVIPCLILYAGLAGFWLSRESQKP